MRGAELAYSSGNGSRRRGASKTGKMFLAPMSAEKTPSILSTRIGLGEAAADDDDDDDLHGGVHEHHRVAGDFLKVHGVESVLKRVVVVILRGRFDDILRLRMRLQGVKREKDKTWRRRCVATLRTGAH